MARRGLRARAVAIAVRRRREPDPVPWWMWALLALGLLLAGSVHAEVAHRAGPPPGVQDVLPPAASAPTIPPGAGGSGTAPTPRPRSENPRADDAVARTGDAAPIPDRGILAGPPAGDEAKAAGPGPNVPAKSRHTPRT